MSWLNDASANRHIKTYVKDFLDVSGNTIIRNGDLDINDGDVIVSSGNVGIGTSSPSAQLDVSGGMRAAYDSDTTSYFGRTAIGYTAYNGWAGFSHKDRATIGNYALMQDSGGTTLLNASSGQTIKFNINNSAMMTLSSSGYLGIGTTSPSAPLHVNSATDTYNILGAASVGTSSAGNAHFGYGSNYAVRQTSDGYTYVNGQGTLDLRTNGNQRMIIDTNGFVGIGTATPGVPFGFFYNGGGGGKDTSMYATNKGYVSFTRGTGYANYSLGRINTNFDNGHPGIMWQNYDDNYWLVFMNKTSYTFEFALNGSGRGYLNTTATSHPPLNFTGQHRNFIENIKISQAETYKGLIVCANKNDYIAIEDSIDITRGKKAITINDALPFLSLAVKEQDKTCYGVISDAEDDEDKRTYSSGLLVTTLIRTMGDTRFYINAVGEGAIWVSNKNGALESGDYITTSSIPGYGQKQNDDILHNYSVAKITMDCDFNPALQYVKQIKRENIEFIHDVNGDYWQDASGNTYHNPGANYFEDVNGNRVFYDEQGKYIYDFNVKKIKEFYDPSGNMIQYTTNYYHAITKELIYGYRLETKDDGSYGLPCNYSVLYENPKYNIRKDASNNVIEVTENILNEHKEIQWEDTEEQEIPYKIRHLDPSGNIITEEEYNTKIAANEEAYIAAFVGCTYHCG